MEINRDAMMRVVKAARAAMRMAENMRPLMVDQKGSTWADEIYGFLEDALFIMSGEVLKAGQGFDDSNTIRILQSDMDDRACADWFIMMDKIRRRVGEPEETADGEIGIQTGDRQETADRTAVQQTAVTQVVQQPTPRIMNAADFDRHYRKNGGYKTIKC